MLLILIKCNQKVFKYLDFVSPSFVWVKWLQNCDLVYVSGWDGSRDDVKDGLPERYGILPPARRFDHGCAETSSMFVFSRSQWDLRRLQASEEEEQSLNWCWDGFVSVQRHLGFRLQRPQWPPGQFLQHFICGSNLFLNQITLVFLPILFLCSSGHLFSWNSVLSY